MDGLWRTVRRDRPNQRAGGLHRSTYAHLFGLCWPWLGLKALMLDSGVGIRLLNAVAFERGAWLGLMVLFIGGGYAAQYMAGIDCLQDRRNTWSCPLCRFVGHHVTAGSHHLHSQHQVQSHSFASSADDPDRLRRTDSGSLISKKIFPSWAMVSGLPAYWLSDWWSWPMVTGLDLRVWFSLAMIALASAASSTTPRMCCIITPRTQQFQRRWSYLHPWLFYLILRRSPHDVVCKQLRLIV